MMVAEPINYTSFRSSPETLITGGTSSFIHELNAIVKVPKPDDLNLHSVECAIYLRLGRHPRIVDVYHISRGKQNLLILEKMEMSLRMFLRQPKARPLADDQILLFAKQLAEGYMHLHSNAVHHIDIGAHNVLIDKSHSNLKLCDFGGSSLDGSEPLVYAGTRAQCPWVDDSSIETELFAFGSLLYELSTGREPYDDKPLSDIKSLFLSKQFPSVHHLVLGPVINKCWEGRYTNTGAVTGDIHNLWEVYKIRSAELSTILQQNITYGGLFLSIAICIWLSKRWNR